jgi:hypothetical protein
MSPDSAISDIIAVADAAFPESSVVDILDITDSAELTPNIFYGLVASDIVGITDIASLFSSVVDAVSISESAELSPNIFYPLDVSDVVAIAEAASLFSTALDSVQLLEAASLPLSSVTDVVDIVVSTSIVLTKSISDQFAVEDSFFDIAATFNRSFNEMLVLPDCIFTNESGLCTRVGLANIAIGDLLDLLFESNNSPVEQIAVADEPTRNFTGGRGTAETMQAADLRSMSVVSPAPNATLPVITTAMTETMELAGASDPKEAVQVGGTWEMDGFDNESLESLIAVMGMPIYNTSTAASSAGAGNMTMVLPTFLVDAEIGGEQPEGGAFLTPTVSEIPAGMQVMIPIDGGGSLNGGGPDALGNLTLSFTPADDTGNFTMMVAMLEDNPEQVADALPRGIGAFFIDISFAGEFGASTPANSSYYDTGGLPRLAFTLSEEWALENNLRRQGGIPVPVLFLLNENTGEWEEIGDIDLPDAATDGVYTYTATLPHMSTYFIMGEPRRQGTSEPDVLLVDLAESLSIKSVAGTGGHESSGRSVIKDLSESLGLSASQPQPLHQRVLTVHNVTVAVSVADIHAAGIGTAVARLDFEITNSGGTGQEIVISYWYSSGGQRLYEGEQMVTIGSGESGIRSVEIPFGEAGVYEIMIEAMASDQTLASTDIVVEVPWLAANLYVFVITAGAVVVASIVYVIYAMRTRLAAAGK